MQCHPNRISSTVFTVLRAAYLLISQSVDLPTALRSHISYLRVLYDNVDIPSTHQWMLKRLALMDGAPCNRRDVQTTRDNPWLCLGEVKSQWWVPNSCVGTLCSQNHISLLKSRFSFQKQSSFSVPILAIRSCPLEDTAGTSEHETHFFLPVCDVPRPFIVSSPERQGLSWNKNRIIRSRGGF